MKKITIIDYIDSTGLFRASKVQILENIRFFKGEKRKLRTWLGKSLGELGDVYIFDAFGTAHRKRKFQHIQQLSMQVSRVRDY